MQGEVPSARAVLMDSRAAVSFMGCFRLDDVQTFEEALKCF